MFERPACVDCQRVAPQTNTAHTLQLQGVGLAQAMLPLLLDPAARNSQKRDLAEAMEGLGLGGEPPSLRAARALLEFVHETAPQQLI